MNIVRNKKIMAIACVCALVFTACNNGSEKNVTPTPVPTATIAPTETQEPTLEPTIVPGGNEDDNGFTEPAYPEVSEELRQIYEAIRIAYGEDYAPNMMFDTTSFQENFILDPDWYDYAIAERPMISAQVDTLIAVHATDGNITKVEDALKAYRDRLINDTFQYPSNLTKLQSSRVETVGDYVFFIMLGFLEQGIEYETNDQYLEAYDKLNQIAVDAIKTVIE